jgi:hypothetical protein
MYRGAYFIWWQFKYGNKRVLGVIQAFTHHIPMGNWVPEIAGFK